jgi:hypothetical protein
MVRASWKRITLLAKRRRSPQEKKQISYKKDRRPQGGESVHGARRAIPWHKRNVNEDFRRKVKQTVRTGALRESDDMDAALKSIKRKNWKKYPDAPLGEMVNRKKPLRLSHFRAKINRRAKQVEQNGV